MGREKIATTLGLPWSTTTRWLQRLCSESEGLFLVSTCSRSHLDLCVICAFFVGPRITSGTCSCQDACCWHHCRHTILHSRQFSQTSAGIWHRARPQQSAGVREGGVRANEASDMWDSCGFPFEILIFVALPQVKNQHLTALNKRRRHEWCTSMLERIGESKRT